MSIRSFVALPVPERIAADLGDTAARLACQDKDGRVRWIDEENYHVTLAFLGEVDSQTLDDLALDLEGSLGASGPVDLKVDSVALFPWGRRPKLIAAMLEVSPRLQELHDAVVRAARRLSIPVEKRRFHPHVTLGRLRAGGTRRIEFSSARVELKGVASEVMIFESTLTASGAIYDSLYEIPLDMLAASDESVRALP